MNTSVYHSKSMDVFYSLENVVFITPLSYFFNCLSYLVQFNKKIEADIVRSRYYRGLI